MEARGEEVVVAEGGETEEGVVADDDDDVGTGSRRIHSFSNFSLVSTLKFEMEMRFRAGRSWIVPSSNWGRKKKSKGISN